MRNPLYYRLNNYCGYFFHSCVLPKIFSLFFTKFFVEQHMSLWHNTTYWWNMLIREHTAKFFLVVISWNVKKGDWFFPPWKSISLLGKHNRLFHSCPITILSFKLDICDRWWWELAVLVHIIYHERKPTNICIHLSKYKRKYTVFQKQIYSYRKSKYYLTQEWMTSLLR